MTCIPEGLSNDESLRIVAPFWFYVVSLSIVWTRSITEDLLDFTNLYLRLAGKVLDLALYFVKSSFGFVPGTVLIPEQVSSYEENLTEAVLCQEC